MHRCRRRRRRVGGGFVHLLFFKGELRLPRQLLDKYGVSSLTSFYLALSRLGLGLGLAAGQVRGQYGG